MFRRASLVATALALTACARAATVPMSALPARSSAPARIAYTVAVPDPATHWYDIGIDIRDPGVDTLLLQLPVWSPGRYAEFDFAKNLTGFSATTAGGTPVAWDRVNGSRWRLHVRGDSIVHIRYRVFANTLSGTFSVADTAHVNWNGASLFMYVVGHKPDPVQLTVVPPSGWHVINGASTRPDQLVFHFPNYDQLIDTPTEVAPSFSVDSFTVDGRLYRVMVHHNGPEHGQRARFVRGVEHIVRYDNRVIAPPPLRMYTFLFNIGYHGSDGMEHLYSTQIMDPRPWTDTATLLPGLADAAHEYFHTWNVKRIRPMALGPFDYTRPQYEPSLWVAEGWTQYYGEIGLLRAGLIDTTRYYHLLGARIRVDEETPGARAVSARTSSIEAPFWDGGRTPMATDRRATWISYYLRGDALALTLDLMIRSRTNGARSLDDALRNLKHLSWDAPNASYYLQGRGYTEADVERAASEAAGTDLHAWFEKYVGGVAPLPWLRTLALAGLALTVDSTATPHRYVVRELPGADAAQRHIRAGWLAGTSGSAPAVSGTATH